MAGSKKRLKTIHINLHHTPEGEHDGFSIEHSYETAGAGGAYAENYGQREHQGVHTSHGGVMEHVHEHVKDHGPSVQEELEDQSRYEEGSGGAAEAKEKETGCVMCSDPDKLGESETKKAHLTNIAGHGYEKGSSAAYGGSGGHSTKHPGFKAVQSKIASKEHLSSKAAGAILASRTRGASKAAHKANPRLARVR